LSRPLAPPPWGSAGVWREAGRAGGTAGRPESALVEYKKALDAGDHNYWIYANLAASYALLGKMDEAKPYVAETLRVNPSFTIKWY
jgi:tetratricopeptide (TPR) repeat protein